MVMKECCQYWRGHNILTEHHEQDVDDVVMRITKYIEVKFCPQCGGEVRGEAKRKRKKRDS